MDNKPEYRIRVIIEDANTGEEVNQASGPLYSTDADTLMAGFSALNDFRNRAKAEHEAVHYPKDEE